MSVMAAALVGALTSRYRRREPRLVSAPRLLPASDLERWAYLL